ncbi:uncharacterized protein M421DRAFT_1883 [Didymella exigua CBS 183.55]|uniref:Uncharacterized protein n=1 Tax=Didymella exigua CBS 183.55 TaxID=1150837 RepID=A0A6A5RXF7_9PLEO|nr:uncharacterized protein M421DRAFT_1883 [Didymella exigua CBS 183.55]KAF1932229.1 hypothetical protein M421DRAFT_1883 [Didymella exigua CBS 183.55]
MKQSMLARRARVLSNDISLNLQHFAQIASGLVQEDLTAPRWLKQEGYTSPETIVWHLVDRKAPFIDNILDCPLDEVNALAAKDLNTASSPLTPGVEAYIITLHKDDVDEDEDEVRLSCGSATNAASGIIARFQQYDSRGCTQVCIQEAEADGFEVVNKVLVAWSPMPEGSNPSHW